MVKFENDNLTLRPIRKNDAERIYEFANNKNVADSLRDYFPHPYSLNDAHEYIEMISNLPVLSNFVIALDDQFVGMIGLIPQGDVYRHTGELGYWIGEPFWGQGIVTKAIELIVTYGFEEMGLKKIIACIFGFNIASGRVLLKNGFIREGVIRDAVFKHGTFYEEVRFGISNPNFKI